MRVCKGLGVDPDKIPLEILPPLGLFSDAYIAELKRIVAEDHIGMVVIDTYSSALPADGSSFNESAFRLWADALGRFSNETDVLVVMLVHETKSARGQEGIRGISGHGSLAGAVQAAIALERPDEDKPYEILVRCARATRKGFAPFLIRWSDGENDSLMATKGEAVAKVKRKRGDAANDNRSAKKSDEVRKTGLLMMESTKPSLCYTLKEVNENGGGGANVNKIALQLLRKAGMIEHVRGKYSKTEKGRNATPQEIALALGFDGVAQREK